LLILYCVIHLYNIFVAMKRFLPLTLVCYLISYTLCAQTSPVTDIGTIQQNLKKLNVLGSVLYIAAHPDDENTRLLAYLAQEKHYRTGYLSLTRGDGGQNLIGTEQSELLGLTRTQELLAARRIDGAEQFFTRANDFGFSKGPDETLKIWDKDKILGDIVWVIRNFRPDVIICRFPTTGEGGHGHHTSSAILAQEAFSAAADPKRYPEQLKYVQVWQAKRLLWNTFSFGSLNTTSPDQFKINVGGYNPFLGKSYGEIAAESRSSHKTQGFGSAKQRGDAYEYFKTILGDAPKTDLLDGVNTTWTRINGTEEIAAEVATLNKNFNAEMPEKAVPALLSILGKADQLSDAYWKAQKTAELKKLTVQCAGLWFESYANEASYALDDIIKVRTQVILRSNVPVTVTVKNNSTSLVNNNLTNIDSEMPADNITQPYWLKNPHSVGFYNTDYLDSGKLVWQKTLPQNIPPSVSVNFKIYNTTITYQTPVEYKYTDAARGEVYQPLVIAPPVTADIQNKVYVFNSKQPQTVQVKLKSFTNESGSISMKPIAGWKITPDKIDFNDKKKGDEWAVAFSIVPTNNKPNTTILEAVAANNKSFSLGVQSIKYNHIPAITLFPPAQAKLVNLDLKTAGKKIGYIAGAGDLVPEALQQVGYEVHQLTESEVLNTDLSIYDAIITGVRAYNVDERLRYEQAKLLEYVNKGGNLVLQYNNNNGLVVRELGPYPFRVVNERVTDENAPVSITDAQNPVLNYPNHITQDDFKGWVQERSLYMASGIDSKYSAPLQMNDPGEGVKNGALIVANYGKGRYIYTSLAFFRELPAGVPGAYRLFVNLLSKPKK
jgi:LmbE family N-acetylglucosaminyl deacetylase